MCDYFLFQEPKLHIYKIVGTKRVN